ncbi:MAG: hypothetical protein J4G12_08980 [Gemmatimonadetes bacterium]|nr:hypothetical protein [Gemmatimonadota bacterium]
MENIRAFFDYLLENPVFLVPLLILGAVLVYGILKRLFKVVAIVVIAAGLYYLLMEYFGPGAPDLGLDPAIFC